MRTPNFMIQQISFRSADSAYLRSKRSKFIMAKGLESSVLPLSRPAHPGVEHHVHAEGT